MEISHKNNKKRRFIAINDISAVLFLLIAVFIMILCYIYALDVEYSDAYSKRMIPLSDWELNLIREYRLYKQNPKLSTYDFSNPVVYNRVKEFLKGLNDLNIQKAIADARMAFRGNILCTGAISFLCMALLSYIVLRNQ